MMTQSKRQTKKGLILALALIMVLGSLLIPTGKANAAQQVTVQNKNNANYDQFYSTGSEAGKSYSFKFIMPKNGVLELFYFYIASPEMVTLKDSTGKTVPVDASLTEDLQTSVGAHKFYSNLKKGAAYTLTIKPAKDQVNFYLLYSPTSAPLKNGKEIYGGTKTNGVSFYQATVAKNGTLKIQMKDAVITGNPRYYVQLLTADKKPVTHSFELLDNSNSGITTFGVKKGTYLIAVKTDPSNPAYSITATAKAVKTVAGASRNTAVTLKAKTPAKGVIYAKDKEVTGVRWYKLNVTRDHAVKIVVKTQGSAGGNTNGHIRFDLFSARSKKPITKTYDASNPDGEIQPYTIGNGYKLRKGTYYIRMSGEDYGNGFYSLAWK